jgi:hypothetical protein
VTKRGYPAWVRATLGLACLAFCAAPTPGDIGGCGQKPQELGAPEFFELKNSIDCERCTECALSSSLCDRACETTTDERTFPAGCVPLVHDGEVCLRALLYASCEDYAVYVDDRGPSVPTECDFCPAEAK